MQLLEETPYGGMRVMAFETTVVATIVSGGRTVATVSADFLPIGGMNAWWINRLLVSNPEQRGRGIGTFLIARLKRAIDEIGGVPELCVSPGGYTNDTERQFRFYLKQGFQRVDGEPDLLELRWEPPV